MAAVKVFKCPKCGSYKVPVYRTTDGVNYIARYRKCKDCSHTFKTVETYEDFKKGMWKIRQIINEVYEK